MTWWYLSGRGMTVSVRTDEGGRIVEGAPIVRKFKGQPLANLERWLRTKAVRL